MSIPRPSRLTVLLDFTEDSLSLLLVSLSTGKLSVVIFGWEKKK